MLIGGFMETGVAIGGVTFNHDCQIMFERLQKAKRRYGLDIKGMDMGQGKDVQMCIIEMVRKLFVLLGWPMGDFQKFRSAYLSVIFWCVHYKYDVIFPMSGMPSGFVGTTVQNCLIIILCMVLCAIRVSAHYNRPIEEVWAEMVNLIYGDDQAPGFLDMKIVIPFEVYVASFESMGFQVTTSNKLSIDKARSEELVNGIEFLKRKFNIIDYNGKTYVVMKLSFDSIYRMLTFYERSSALTRSEWASVVFDNAQFELAFHGEEVYAKSELVFTHFKAITACPKKVQPWGFWIEKFLSGVAPYTYS
jgi:hypothetical protein